MVHKKAPSTEEDQIAAIWDKNIALHQRNPYRKSSTRDK